MPECLISCLHCTLSSHIVSPRHRRAAKNEALKIEASKTGERLNDKLKRQPAVPRDGHFVSARNNAPEDVAPIAFDFLI
jgi:hypothetical protein